MKIGMRIGLLSILLLFATIAKAQESSKIAFNKGVDYLHKQLAIAYCEKFASAHPKSQEANSFRTVIQGKLQGKIGDTMTNLGLVAILSDNKFGSYARSLPPELEKCRNIKVDTFTKQQAAKVLLDSLFAVRDTKLSGVISQPAFQKKRDTLKSELEGYFDGKFPSQPITDTPHKVLTVEELQGAISQLENKVNTIDHGFFSATSFLIIQNIIIILFLILVIVLFSKITSLREDLQSYSKDQSKSRSKSGSGSNKEWADVMNQSNSGDVGGFKKKVEQDITEINTAIGTLQKELFHFQEKEKRTRKNDATNTANDLGDNDRNNSKPGNKNEIYYTSIPNKDSSFSEANFTRQINPIDSFYKITIKDSNKAVFEFLNDERAVKSAISSPELILFPVCTIKGTPNSNTKRLRTTTPGSLSKKSDKWEVDTLAIVEYE